jgi:hypothetical protein
MDSQSDHRALSFHSSLRLLVLSGLLVAMTFAVVPQIGAQEQELVTNGGFEEGMLGWTAVNAYPIAANQRIYYDVFAHPPHSGKFSAVVGTDDVRGTLSQNVSIPPKSKATFSAWYRIEPGASLTILLKASDGSAIRQWPEFGTQSWTQITYDLSAAYAGQTITIEFDGEANELLLSEAHYCIGGYSNNTISPLLCPLYNYADYFAFVDDVSMVATPAQYMTNVSIAGLPQSLSTKLLVDGTQIGAVNGGKSQQLAFTIGDTHTISTQEYVYQDNTTRYHCESYSYNVTTDTQLAFWYTRQYYLSVASPIETTQGTGWYDDGSTARFSLSSATSPMTGLAGTLGAKLVFDKWSGDASTSDLQSTIIMDRPKSISAVWRDDYSTPYLLVTVIAIAVVGTCIGYRRFSRGRGEETMVYGEEEPVVIGVTPPDAEATGPFVPPTEASESQSTDVAKTTEEVGLKKRRSKNGDSEDENDAARAT